MISDGRSNRYDVTSIDIRGQHDVPAGRLLFDAQRELRRGNFDAAINLCHEAQTLSPTYPEAWRIEALIHDRRQDRYSTLAAFERAHEIAENSPIIGYHFGSWLSESAGDQERALSILQSAAREDQESPQIVHQIARTHFYLENYRQAIDSCRAMSVVSQNPQYAQANIDLALRAGVFGTEDRYWRSDFAAAVEMIEVTIDFLKSLRAEQIDSISADWLMRLSFLAGSIASNSKSADYLSRRAHEFSGLLTEKVRVADASALQRETAQVVRLDREKHFGFIRLGGQDFFFHHNDLVVRNEWNTVEENTLVAFLPGPSNSKGPRATQIRVLA